jgi:hypothetical protein
VIPLLIAAFVVFIVVCAVLSGIALMNKGRALQDIARNGLPVNIPWISGPLSFSTSFVDSTGFTLLAPLCLTAFGLFLLFTSFLERESHDD